MLEQTTYVELKDSARRSVFHPLPTNHLHDTESRETKLIPTLKPPSFSSLGNQPNYRANVRPPSNCARYANPPSFQKIGFEARTPHNEICVIMEPAKMIKERLIPGINFDQSHISKLLLFLKMR